MQSDSLHYFGSCSTLSPGVIADWIDPDSFNRPSESVDIFGGDFLIKKNSINCYVVSDAPRLMLIVRVRHPFT